MNISSLLKNNYDENSRVLIRNISYGASLKVINFGILFLTVPLLIDCLSPQKYGIWITLLSLGAWFNMTDFGLGNGLRNKLTESVSKGNTEEAKKSISIVYSSVLFGCMVFSVIFSIVIQFIDWDIVFNVPSSFTEPLAFIVTIFGIGTLWVLFLKLVYNIFYAYQQIFVVNVIDTCIQLVTFMGLIMLKFFVTNISLLNVVSLFIGIQIGVLIVINLMVYRLKYDIYVPVFKKFSVEESKPLLKLSGSFFGVQIVGWFMYLSDNLLITQLFGTSEVANYNIAYRYFAILGIVWGLSYASIWSIASKSFSINDLRWIKKMVKVINFSAIITVLLALFLLAFSEAFYHLWVGERTVILPILSVSVAVYWFLNAFSQGIFSITNGMGKMRLQFVLNLILSILNIVIAIFLSKYTTLGVACVPLATSICLVIQLVFMQIQCYKILNNSAFGIWDK